MLSGQMPPQTGPSGRPGSEAIPLILNGLFYCRAGDEANRKDWECNLRRGT